MLNVHHKGININMDKEAKETKLVHLVDHEVDLDRLVFILQEARNYRSYCKLSSDYFAGLVISSSFSSKLWIELHVCSF